MITIFFFKNYISNFNMLFAHTFFFVYVWKIQTSFLITGLNFFFNRCSNSSFKIFKIFNKTYLPSFFFYKKSSFYRLNNDNSFMISKLLSNFKIIKYLNSCFYLKNFFFNIFPYSFYLIDTKILTSILSFNLPPLSFSFRLKSYYNNNIFFLN